MISRSLAVGLLAAGCLGAAAGGSYLAVRQNAPQQADAAVAQPPSAASEPDAAVTETEAVVTPEPPPPPRVADAASPPAERRVQPAPQPRRVDRPTTRQTSSRPAQDTAPVVDAPSPAAAAAPVAEAVASAEEIRPRVDTAPARPTDHVFEEIVVPGSSVIGLELERTITSEQAEMEDRIEARVTRDVYAGGRRAIPAGSRVVGTVTLVERGGKMKERARLGVRFHTLILADGRQMPLRTETVYREGDSPGAESSRKIGGAAIGGAVLGAILGGGKGAATGAAVGAAGGTAAVMAGGRKPATLASGSVLTVRLSAPIVLEIER